MFTGLVEAIGTVLENRRAGLGGRLAISVEWPDGEPPRHGDSVAVDGACLTVTEPSDQGFAADISPETSDRTLLAELRARDTVNLERALRIGDRLGGHLVQGHVDGIVQVLAIREEGRFARWRFALPPELALEVAPKGSVAIHGVSLTVAAMGDSWFEVALIPETLSATTLSSRRTGSRLHIETDVLAKYVGRRLTSSNSSAIEELFGRESDDA